MLLGNKWVNIGTTIFNRISAQAAAGRGDNWANRQWNRLVDRQKAQITRRLAPLLRPVMRRHKLPETFQYAVEGDVLAACLLQEFADAPAAAWSQRIIDWYLAGHIPCGFTGAVPAGKSTDPTVLPDLKKGKLVVF